MKAIRQLIVFSFFLIYSFSHAEGHRLKCRGIGHLNSYLSPHENSRVLDFEGTVDIRFSGCQWNGSEEESWIDMDFTRSDLKDPAFPKNTRIQQRFRYHPAKCEDSVHSYFMWGYNLNSVSLSIDSTSDEQTFYRDLNKGIGVPLRTEFLFYQPYGPMKINWICVLEK